MTVPEEPRSLAADVPRADGPPTRHGSPVLDRGVRQGRTDGNAAADGAPGTDGQDGTTVDAAEEAPSKGRRVLRTVLEWAAVIGGALLVALLVKTFLVQAFWIPSPSMRPTLQEGDRVLVNKLADGIGDLNRGDIVVFKRPDNGENDRHEESDISDLIKRVVGLPGDELEGRNGILYVDGQRQDEPYVLSTTPTGDFGPLVVPEGHIYVLGDNRTNSQDSRYFGPVPGENIVGRAFVRIWPLSNLGRL